MICTEKKYYNDMFLKECDALVLDVIDNKVILDQTVAYPEGGGQISDIGYLCFDDKEIPFFDAKKGVGRVLSVKDFPTVCVDTPIYHFVEEQYISFFEKGQKVKVKIDIDRRRRTTVHHSALHLALMYACDLKPDLMKNIKGCKITTEYGRLDFFLTERFSEEDINYISEKVNLAVNLGITIKSYHYPKEKEAWYWQCEDFICPCGGTHVVNTKQLGKLNVKRKSVGKNTERLIVSSDCEQFPKELYH